MRRELLRAAVWVALAWPGIGWAQGDLVQPAAGANAMVAAAKTQTPSTAPSLAIGHLLMAGTVVPIELAEPVSTKAQKRGDMFAIRLAAPIVVDGETLVPMGAPGLGQVVDAGGGGLGGRPGKLILAARYVQYQGVRVPLRGFHLAAVGRDNGSAAMAVALVPYVGLLSLAITGGDVSYPAGMEADAKVAAEVVFPPDAPAAGAPPPPSAPPANNSPVASSPLSAPAPPSEQGSKP